MQMCRPALSSVRAHASEEAAELDARVRACLALRKVGTTDAEVRRVTKTLRRLQPAATDARQKIAAGEGATASPQELAKTLRALADD
jgi:hypothetical protein